MALYLLVGNCKSQVSSPAHALVRRSTACELTLDRTTVNILCDSLGTSSLDLATHTICRAQNFLDGTGKILGEGLEPHGPRDLDNIFQGDALRVLNVLLLLSVARGFFQGLDNQGGGCGYYRYGGLTVLDGELDGNSQSFLHNPYRQPVEAIYDDILRHGDATAHPVTGSLGDVFTNFLRRQTQGTNLGG